MAKQSLSRKIYYTLNSGKNPKFVYYIKNVIRQKVPKAWLNKRLDQELAKLDSRPDKEYIMQRVNYYCKLLPTMAYDREQWQQEAIEIGRQPMTSQSVYYYDALEYARWFDQHLKWILRSGDIDYALPLPSIVKSRPIHEENSFNVMLNLEKVRHFLFVNDKKPFTEKKDMAIFRGKIGQQTGRPDHIKMNRYDFAKQFFGHPMFDIGAIGHQFPEWQSEKLTIGEHLDYKFIMSLEGNDVASNLKWVMSSNSIAVTPPLTCETWFMEGTLKPDYHYIEIKPDFSDIEEKLRYYSSHPEEAQQIIAHAHEYIDQFRDKKREKLISLLVLKRYFELTN
ncbi:MAG: glycosyl transferase family 90 [Prevotella sp.]